MAEGGGDDAALEPQATRSLRGESNSGQQEEENRARRSGSSVSKTSWYTVGSSLGEKLCRAVIENDAATVRKLLQMGANTEAEGDDGKKPLLIASERGLIPIMVILLSNGAEVDSTSDSNNTTALIRACEEGQEAAVHLLIEVYGANIEARRRDGHTPLFIAVEAANESLVKYLLEHGANKSQRVSDGRTVLDCAEGNDNLIALLSKDHLLQGPEIGKEQAPPEPQFKPVHPPAGPEDITQLSAVQSMQATIVGFFIGRREQRSQPISVPVYDLIYGNGPDSLLKTYTGNARSDPTFTWYHLPANNDLITRLLADRSETQTAAMPDDEFRYMVGLKNLVDGQGKRASRTAFTFMRPSCKSFRNDSGTSWRENSLDGAAAFIPFLSSESFQDYDAMSRVLSMAKRDAAALVESRPASPLAQEGRHDPRSANVSQPLKFKTPPPKVLKWLAGSAPPQKKRRPYGIGEAAPEIREMSPNELHIRGYGVTEVHGQIPFQPRRSLDQYSYSQLENTAARDQDQVIYRYTKIPENSREPKIFMVDQMWMWIINGDTLITCTPTPWRHGRPTGLDEGRLGPSNLEEYLQRGPVIENYLGHTIDHSIRSSHSARGSVRVTFERNHNGPQMASLEADFLEDPLSVHQKVLRHLQQTARKPIASLYDLAGLIATCCASTFDETQVPDEYQFFDFFEDSISTVNEKITRSLHDFKRSLTASAAARKSAKGHERFQLELMASEHEDLNFTSEIDLVVETEDIKDELNILKAVLDDQKRSMNQLKEFLHESSSRVRYVDYKDDDSNLVDQTWNDIQGHRIKEMSELAEKALSSLRHLIDLKQKQANFSEAISARELARKTAENTELQIKQAQETTRQGKTLMVFTVVTIIFLPLSFLAAFFAINVDAFPWDQNDKIELNYLLKYILSIGFALAIPFIGLAFSIDEIGHGMVKVIGMGKRGQKAGRAGHGMTRLGEGWKSSRRFFAPGVITLAAMITGLVLVLVWTSSLATQNKVTTTVCFGTFLVLAVISKGLYKFVHFARIRESTVGSQPSTTV